MKKFLLFLFVLIVLDFSGNVVFAAYHVKINELYASMKKYDGKQIRIEGEVIGDIVYHRDGAWINVNDDVYSKRSIAEGNKPKGQNSGIGIWVSKEDAKKVKFKGDYFHKGDIVYVEGIFSSNCPKHNGDIDIHAKKFMVVKQGYEIDHDINLKLAMISMGFFIFAASGYSIRRFRITRPGYRRVKA